MSNKTYQIKEGDQLLKIAVEQGVNYFKLLELNPSYQTNPNLIHPGQVLILSAEEEEPAEPEQKEAIKPPAELPVSEEGSVQGKPACKGMDVSDVLLYTDDGPENYIVLNEEQQKLILEEAENMALLASELQEITNAAPNDKAADKEAIEAHKVKKQAWLDRVEEAGVFDIDAPSTHESKDTQTSTQVELTNKITNLTQRKQILDKYYSDNWLWGDEDSVKNLRDKIIADINSQIEELKLLQTKDESNANSNAQTVKQKNIRNKKGKSRTFKAGVREAILLSQDKVIYIRTSFIEKQSKSWKSVSSSPSLKEALKSKSSQKALIGAMFSDIKNDIVKDGEASKFGNLEQNWYSNPLLDKKYKKWAFSADSASSSADDARFAISGEAQLMRFCFHTDVKSAVDLKDGNIDLGVSAGAELGLVEGNIKTSLYLPYQRGYQLYITYSDANGKDVNYPFGQFRGNVSVTLSCFVGATASASENVSVNAAPKETDGNSGVSALFSNRVALGVSKPSAGGKVGLKGEGFAGAQAGGQVSGALEWEAPDNIGKSKFDALAEIQLSGNMALGVGVSAEFRLELTGTEFIFYCKAALVFGPGGSGGFGTKVNFDKIWPLAKVIWGALAVADYRTLQCINKDAYRFLTRAAYYFFTLPSKALDGVINGGVEPIEKWWGNQMDVWHDRELRCAEAKQVAKTIVNSGGKYNGMDQNQLPPETIGMLMDTLVQTFYWNSEEEQEKAILILLSGSIGGSWRKFEEVLAHMNPAGEKKSGDQVLFDNLNRINAILVGDQQTSFNNWVKRLSEGGDDVSNRVVAFSPRKGPAFQAKLPLVEKQIESVTQFYA